jgi:hypothetical protein
MTTKRIAGVLLGFALVSGVTVSCSKDTTVLVDNTPAITRTVSFATDIAPVLTKNCAVSGCHNTGGHVPDLTASNAYNALTAGNYLNSGAPETSLVYLWLTGKKSTPMPQGQPNNPSSINQLMLAWITQGAKNN